MQRVVIIGSPGSGKSTLAAELARVTGLPLLHLDRHYWRAGWTEPTKEEWEACVRQLIAAERWVMDGNFGGTLALRLSRADTIVDLRFPTWLCLWRVFKRIWSSRGRVRSDMAEGCPEKWDFPFLLYVANFSRTGRKRADGRIVGFEGKYIAFRNPAEVRAWLARLDQPG